MSERDKSEHPEPGTGWTSYNIPEFGEEHSFADALEAHRRDGDLASERARAAEERGATSESRTDWTADEGQYIASDADADSWAAGQEWGQAAADPEPAVHPEHPAHSELPAHHGGHAQQHWGEPAPQPSVPVQPAHPLSQPTHPQAAPPAATAPPRRTGLFIGLAIAAVVVIGGIIAGITMFPSLFDGRETTPATEAVESTADATSAPPATGDATTAPATTGVLAGVWDGTTNLGTGEKVDYIVSIYDDGVTAGGTVEYPAFNCTSRLDQKARDAETVTFIEEGVTGACSYDSLDLIVHLPTPEEPDTARLEIGNRDGVLVRR